MVLRSGLGLGRAGAVALLAVGALVAACRREAASSSPPAMRDAALADGAASVVVAVADSGPDTVDAAAVVDAAGARAQVVEAGAPDGKPGPLPRGGGARVGKRGDVCRTGSRSGRADDLVVTCGPGLECCYPCGIEGCDWVCHTPSECEQDRERP